MILLNFNIINPEIPEEFLQDFSVEDYQNLAERGTENILKVLAQHHLTSTFFVEISLVKNLENLIKNLVKNGHEVALLNKNSSIEEVQEAKSWIERLIDKNIRGIRQFPENRIDSDTLKKMNFIYRSPMDFSDIFFLFKRLQQEVKAYEESELMVIPESVSPYSQLPYNDFTFQMIPMTLYQNMVNESLQNDDYVLIYLNSWQFLELNDKKYGLNLYRKYNLGDQMVEKLDEFLTFLNEKEFAVSRMKDFFL